MIIDTHCHLNDVKAFPGSGEVEEARRLGVERLVVVGTGPTEWSETIRLSEVLPSVFCILGWHPNYTADYDAARLAELRDWLGHPKCLGLGEIGLDYHWDYSPREVQLQALEDQLSLAEELSMPVVFHVREAYADLLTLLEERPGLPMLLHCFAGSAEEAKRASEMGAYFGIDGPISYKNAEQLRDIVRGLPRDRIVVETDAPYMTPVPFRGKSNKPAYVNYVAEALAQALGISLEECSRLTTANAVRFFGNGLLE